MLLTFHVIFIVLVLAPGVCWGYAFQEMEHGTNINRRLATSVRNPDKTTPTPKPGSHNGAEDPEALTYYIQAKDGTAIPLTQALTDLISAMTTDKKWPNGDGFCPINILYSETEVDDYEWNIRFLGCLQQKGKKCKDIPCDGTDMQQAIAVLTSKKKNELVDPKFKACKYLGRQECDNFGTNVYPVSYKFQSWPAGHAICVGIIDTLHLNFIESNTIRQRITGCLRPKLEDFQRCSRLWDNNTNGCEGQENSFNITFKGTRPKWEDITIVEVSDPGPYIQ